MTTPSPSILATLLTLTARAFSRCADARLVSNQNAGRGAAVCDLAERYAHEAAAHANLYTTARSATDAEIHRHACRLSCERATESAAEAFELASASRATTARQPA